MLKHIFWFEVRYWLKSWTLWIFLLVIAVMIFGAASTDDITLGDSLSNTFRNSPYNIQNFYAFIGLNGIWLFALPNGFIIAAILFAVAVWARNEIASFVSSVVLLAGYIASDILLRNVERQKLGAILDPFGIRTYAYFTRYWTVAEKNTVTAGYSG